MSADAAGYAAFISHDSRDVKAAQEIADHLESKGLKCWIAPRDVRPGEEYGGEIIRGIERSKCLVLVLSDAANESAMVRREVERAAAKGKAIYPVRIEDVPPSPKLEFFVATHQWLDAWEGLFGDHIARLAEAIDKGVDLEGKPIRTRRPVSWWVQWGAVAAIIVAAVAIAPFVPGLFQSPEERARARLDANGIAWNIENFAAAIARGDIDTIGLFETGGMGNDDIASAFALDSSLDELLRLARGRPELIDWLKQKFDGGIDPDALVAERSYFWHAIDAGNTDAALAVITSGGTPTGYERGANVDEHLRWMLPLAAVQAAEEISKADRDRLATAMLEHGVQVPREPAPGGGGGGVDAIRDTRRYASELLGVEEPASPHLCHALPPACDPPATEVPAYCTLLSETPKALQIVRYDNTWRFGSVAIDQFVTAIDDRVMMLGRTPAYRADEGDNILLIERSLSDPTWIIYDFDNYCSDDWCWSGVKLTPEADGTLKGGYDLVMQPVDPCATVPAEPLYPGAMAALPEPYLDAAEKPPVAAPAELVLSNDAVALLLLALDAEAFEGGFDKAADKRRRLELAERLYLGFDAAVRYWPPEWGRYDDWQPFFPAGAGEVSPDEVADFAMWSRERAAALPDTLVLRLVDFGWERAAALSRREGAPGVRLSDLFEQYHHFLYASSYDSAGSIEPIEETGIGRERIKGLPFHRDLPGLAGSALVLPDTAGGYTVPFDLAGEEIPTSSVDLVFRLDEVELFGEAPRQVLAIRAEPVAVRFMGPDGAVAEAAVAAPEAIRFPEAVAPPDLLPFDAETIDLLVVRDLPDRFDDDMLYRMMVSRWAYEQAVEDVAWTRVFPPGAAMPDLEFYDRHADDFRAWSEARAGALPEHAVLRDRFELNEQGNYRFFCLFERGLARKDEPAWLGPESFQVNSRQSINVRNSTDCPTQYVSGVPSQIRGQLRDESERLSVGNRLELPLDTLMAGMDIGEWREFDVELELALATTVTERTPSYWLHQIGADVEEIRFYRKGTDELLATASP